MPKQIINVPDDGRITFDSAKWFEGIDVSRLREIASTGVGDATAKGIEMLRQTITAVLPNTLTKVVDEGGAVPLSFTVTLAIVRNPATPGEVARCVKAADIQKANKDKRDEKQENAQDRNVSRMSQAYREGLTAAARVTTTDKIKEALELAQVLATLVPKVPQLPSGNDPK